VAEGSPSYLRSYANLKELGNTPESSDASNRKVARSLAHVLSSQVGIGSDANCLSGSDIMMSFLGATSVLSPIR